MITQHKPQMSREEAIKRLAYLMRKTGSTERILDQIRSVDSVDETEPRPIWIGDRQKIKPNNSGTAVANGLLLLYQFIGYLVELHSIDQSTDAATVFVDTFGILEAEDQIHKLRMELDPVYKKFYTKDYLVVPWSWLYYWNNYDMSWR